MKCICERKPVRDPDGDWDVIINEEGLASNGDSSLGYGVGPSGKIYLVSNGNMDSAEWCPFYCPICGRKIRENDGSFKTIKGRYWAGGDDDDDDD